MKTNYKIVTEGERLTVLDDEKQFTKGFMTTHDALHSIFVENGSKENHYYNVDDDGVVELEVSEM